MDWVGTSLYGASFLWFPTHFAHILKHDLLSWLMEEAFRAGYDTMDVVTRVLTVSSSTTHTSSYVSHNTIAGGIS